MPVSNPSLNSELTSASFKQFAFWQLVSKLVRRELRAGISGFNLFIIALAMGVAAIAAVGSLRTAFEQSIERDAKSLLGGDVELRLSSRSPEPEAIAFFKTQATTVSEVKTLRAMLYTEGEARNLVEVHAVDHAYPLYGQVKIMEGGADFSQLNNKDNATYALFADRRLQDLLGVGIGENLRLGDQQFYLAGFLQSVPDRSTNGLDLGPRVIIPFDALAATGLVQPGSVHRHYTRLILKPEISFDQFKTALEEAFPTEGFRVRGLDRAAPSIQRFLDRVGSFMNLVSLAILVIGGVGAANAIRAFLKKRASTIATLKALGASRELIFAVFLVEVLIMTVAGIICGLILGAGSLWIFLPLLSTAFPIMAETAIYPKPLLIAGGLGLLITLLFTLWSLSQAAAIKASALFRSAAGLGGTVGLGRASPFISFVLAGLLLAIIGLCWLATPDKNLFLWFVVIISGLLAGFSFLGWLVTKKLIKPGTRAGFVPVRLAIAGLSRPDGSVIGIAVSLGLGLTMLVAVADLQGNLNQQLQMLQEEDYPAFFVVDLQTNQREAFDQLVDELNHDSGQTPISSDIVPLLRVTLTKLAGVPVDQIEPPPDYQWVLRGDRGISWARTPRLTGKSKIVDGEWWPPAYEGAPLVSFDAEAAAAFGLKLGDEIELNLLGRPFTATIANFRYVDWSNLDINFLMIFSQGLLEQAPQTLLVSIKSPQAMEAKLERALTDQFNNISVVRVGEIVTRIRTIVQQLAFAVRGIAFMAVAAGLIVLTGAIMAEQHQRQYDSVILKTLGVTRLQQMTAWMLEYGFIAVLASVLAVIAGSGASMYVVRFVMEGEYALQPAAMGVVLLLALLLVLPLGMATSLHMLGKSPLHFLRNSA